jgi:hypothetical protein
VNEQIPRGNSDAMSRFTEILNGNKLKEGERKLLERKLKEFVPCPSYSDTIAGIGNIIFHFSIIYAQ